MLIRSIRSAVALIAVTGFAVLFGAPPASAVSVTNVSVLEFELGLSFDFLPAGNPDLGPLGANGILGNGDFSGMISANTATGGPLAGETVNAIGKVDGGLGTTAINPASTPFVGRSMLIEHVIDSTINGVADLDGFLFTITAAPPLGNEWSIVKLALKDGANANPEYGVFVITNLDDVAGSNTVLRAFISDSEFDKWVTPSPGGTRTDAISHLFAWGVTDRQVQVPAPATLTLLGLGLVGLAVVVRKKARR